MSASAWLLALLAYPLLEELVFRAGLLRWLDAKWLVKLPAVLGRWVGWQPWINNILTSLVFGLAHALTWPISHAVAVFVPSLFLGWLWQRYRSVLVCFTVHAAMNGLGILLDGVGA